MGSDEKKKQENITYKRAKRLALKIRCRYIFKLALNAHITFLTWLVIEKKQASFDFIGAKDIQENDILIDFLLTVKAATLILIYGRGSAISSAKEGKSGFIYNLVESYAPVTHTLTDSADGT